MYIYLVRFEWTETKREANTAKHGIDFADAIELFNAAHFVFRSDRNGEERYGAVGEFGGKVIPVFYHDRQGTTGDARRIFSARRARTSEERDYRDSLK